MTKMENKKKLKKDALLKTAFELFTSKGINKTSIADIVEKAGVAKGTFYLYFNDKYDIRNKLISHKASQLFHKAHHAMQEEEPFISSFEDEIVFFANHIINQLDENKSLLNFISKNLSWGIFKSVLSNPSEENDVNFDFIFSDLIERSGMKFQNPEIMIFMIVELISSTCYSSILYQEPVDINTLKPYLFENIRLIIRSNCISAKPNSKDLPKIP